MNREIFLEAAERVLIGGSFEFCCNVLKDITKTKYSPEYLFLEDFFKPEDKNSDLAWWDFDYESRVIALLLCYEISKP